MLTCVLVICEPKPSWFVGCTTRAPARPRVGRLQKKQREMATQPERWLNKDRKTKKKTHIKKAPSLSNPNKAFHQSNMKNTPNETHERWLHNHSPYIPRCTENDQNDLVWSTQIKYPSGVKLFNFFSLDWMNSMLSRPCFASTQASQ